MSGAQAARPLGWLGIVRIGLVQTAIGAIVLIVTSTMNRVMVVEYALPAIVPGALVGMHYMVQLFRPRMGYGSDRGGRRTPWIIGGMAVLAAGGMVSAVATAGLGSWTAGAVALAVLGFVLVGLGVGASGTALLTLLASRVAPTRRAAAATLVWLMMLAGFAITAISISVLLDPFSPARLVEVAGIVCAAALVLTVVAIRGLEGDGTDMGPARAPLDVPFKQALREVWGESQARSFALYVFISMFAYSAQELVLEPFGGLVFGMTPGQSAGLAGVLHGGVFAGMLIVAVLGSVFSNGRPDALRGWAAGGCLASAVASAGLVAAGVAASAGHSWPLQANVLLLGIANGTFVTAAIGSMMGLASNGRASREGVRMGLWGAAQAIAFGLGGLLGSLATDIARHALGQPALAYAAVFVVQAVLFLLAARQALRVFSLPADSVQRARAA